MAVDAIVPFLQAAGGLFNLATSITSFVHALQTAMNQGEPPHYLCTACFDNGKRSRLQCREGFPRKDGGYAHTAFICGACKAEAATPFNGGLVAPKYAEDVTGERAR